MKTRTVGMVGILALVTMLVSGCVGGIERPGGTLSVAELLESPVYETEVEVYGKVSALGELFCPCFALASGGETIEVWYDLMIEDGGTPRPAVSVEGIENGTWVSVTGELRPSEGELPSKTFWANQIERVE